MKLVKQTLFGSPYGPREEIGNCYPACVASLLELPLSEVPHVHQLYPDDNERACVAMGAFLAERNLCRLQFELAPWCGVWLNGVLAIFGGRSPRGNFNHAVIGEITPTGWKPLFDPYPDSGFLAGMPTDVEIIFEPMKFTRLVEAT